MSTHALTIIGSGGVILPTMGNEELMMLLGDPRPASWPFEKLGIERHSLNLNLDGMKIMPTTGLDYAEMAAQNALRAGGIHPERVKHLVLLTCTPNELHFQRDAITLAHRLGLCRTVTIQQLDPGCAGVASGLQLIEAFYRLQDGDDWYALIVATNDVASSFNRERYQRVRGAWVAPAIFGDGAGAILLGPGEGPHLVGTYVAYEPEHPLVFYRGGGVSCPTTETSIDEHVYLVDVHDVAGSFAPAMERVWQHFSERYGISVGDIGRFYLHQANLNLIKGLVGALGIPEERAPHNVDRFANTVSASTLLLVDEDCRAGRYPKDQPIIFMLVGAGAVEGGALFMP
ncbi:hypothetical protein A3H10_04770 [Candidatus Uhrbacteria bacterium RIFCSPLOWO2_12_FULL_46_10]|uniref:3-oxoacyl-ACP synthase n=1 Tax=Candidatus Uhrbacteria bacterium RIFCSPLOWO2_01_FULL_47_25 TaxID=1802402 RepID=A0A1F7UVY6_9BACT|nr:MAG: hypothetical protein A2752_00875 [Candidatus Uhrbacteria bacterium RIFCSPHIGHO2_01_FULL_46_23]OGL69865.1 MAG: hypothetical protein A3D60_00765 [Candidatus Uhrbacteria bacterium RIFCSPHIGHO2_02_FULL_47_29]OGL75535.1 MAG: hypothetical protein A3E96_01535 [Candidatus Uhrbacteria bacterium RIFCSPHIGHO2_12_FULL_46_13]OGL82462.1 MAG: hypothetical protein A2936_02035 [Candidatus Uhrbacteria bacterium RIFCSPLOWO2_01_FULL_47_25]OGL85240.1 MAG: hypothetical protein A3I37_02835 [Candidatus Uhrbact